MGQLCAWLGWLRCVATVRVPGSAVLQWPVWVCLWMGKGNQRGAGSEGGAALLKMLSFPPESPTCRENSRWRAWRHAGGSVVPMHTWLALLCCLWLGPWLCDLVIAVTVTGCVWERLCSHVTVPAPLQLAVLGPEVCGGLRVRWVQSWFGAFLGKAKYRVCIKGGKGGVCRWEHSLSNHRGSSEIAVNIQCSLRVNNSRCGGHGWGLCGSLFPSRCTPAWWSSSWATWLRTSACPLGLLKSLWMVSRDFVWGVLHVHMWELWGGENEGWCQEICVPNVICENCHPFGSSHVVYRNKWGKS